MLQDEELTRFDFAPPHNDEHLASQIELSLNKFIRDHYLQIEQNSNLLISGSQVVSNVAR